MRATSLLAIGLLVAACEPEPATCVPNETRACLCEPGREGAQVCAASGDAYSACDCDAPLDAGTARADGGEDAGDDAGARPGDAGVEVCRELGPVRAFPGAVGFGAGARGGRGGRVIVVDTLADDGPGSLREALSASGPRVVVFAVSGTILLESSLRITEPHVTVAGQTAPGGGIALRTADHVNTPAILSSADEVVIRYLRVRPGPSTEPSNSVDAITVTAGRNIVLANNSFSWAVDENVNLWYDASDITVQDNLISEALFDSTHTYGLPHSKGFIAGPDNARVSLVRNVFAHNDDRNPLMGCAHPYELINNVGYNGYQVGAAMALSEGTRVNFVGNVYLAGPMHRPSRYQVIVSGSDGGPLVPESIYVRDNLTPRADPSDDWAVMGWGGVHGGDYNGSPLPESVRALTPFEMSDAPAEPIPAAELVDRLLPTVGASRPLRDAVDARVVEDIRSGTGRLIDHPSEVGGWPELASGAPLPDADADGMPDAWETRRGLDPTDPADAWEDRDGDGWSNLEESLECP